MRIEALEKLLNKYQDNTKRLYEGSIISAKIIALEEGKGAIKLYDGTVIPAIFISKDIDKKDQFLKFKIEKIEDNTVILRAIEKNQVEREYSNIKQISDKLSIPIKDAEEIIKSLIKFSLPATDENIMFIYNSSKAVDSIKRLTEEDIKSLLNNLFKIDISNEQLNEIKQYLKEINDIDTDFLTFMLENKLKLSLQNLIGAKHFLNESKFINEIIQSINKLNDGKLTKIFTLEDISRELLKNSDILKTSNEFIEKFDIIRLLNKNYNFYFFNTNINNHTYSNSIIIKNKYKNKNLLDANNIKFYIKVNTQNLGTVESYIQKYNQNMVINLKCEKQHIHYIKNNLNLLSSALDEIGIKLINVNVEEIKESHKNIINFFNDFIVNELDVKV
ncbi:flagellar hook-length control protein FliK [Thermobrachium celere]|uniref:Flagellar hook-length control protein-like C-terminal domain-containing protein n=2 Tax=Thermobrachium TaxID=150333 RepID=R7RR71_9CLOT|nr:flagellar hook-length control protein FliK [Thermobrachium celere]CDF58697.1 hypothetical protein TCEL_00743 [Thermobrachium celere DSM 8682]